LQPETAQGSLAAIMVKINKKRCRFTLSERSAQLLKSIAYVASVTNKRKVQIGELISSLVLNAKPDQWAVVREEIK
jgi:hypothetical protein